MCDTLAHRSFSKQAFRQINELKTTSSLKWLWKAVHLFACVSVIYALISNKLAIDFVELKCLNLLNFPREWKDGYGDFGKSNIFCCYKTIAQYILTKRKKRRSSAFRNLWYVIWFDFNFFCLKKGEMTVKINLVRHTHVQRTRNSFETKSTRHMWKEATKATNWAGMMKTQIFFLWKRKTNELL